MPAGEGLGSHAGTGSAAVVGNGELRTVPSLPSLSLTTLVHHSSITPSLPSPYPHPVPPSLPLPSPPLPSPPLPSSPLSSPGMGFLNRYCGGFLFRQTHTTRTTTNTMRTMNKTKPMASTISVSVVSCSKRLSLPCSDWSLLPVSGVGLLELGEAGEGEAPHGVVTPPGVH